MAKAPSPLAAFDAQLRDTVGPLLAGHGFARAGRARVWVRPSATADGVCHIIGFQVGEPHGSTAGRFTAEVAVYYPRYDRFANGRTPLGPVIPACHLDLRRRVGLLMTPPEDRWWLLANGPAVAAAAVELGLPWLAATDTPATAATYNTGKMPEPDRLRREAFERARAAREAKK